jgi:Sap, sulfolipid-1-addressing protein
LTGLLPTLIADGLGIAAAPWCIIGVIVILGTAHPVANAVAFLGGAVVSMVVVFGLCSLAFGNLDLTVHTTPSSTTAIVQIVVGAALLGWGGWRWYRRPVPAPGAPAPAQPKWLSAIDRVRPVIAFPIGLCMPNPILAVAGSLEILKADLSSTQTAVALVIFMLISLCTLIAPVAVYVRSPDTITTRLEAWKQWLATNSGTILTVLLVFYGALLIAKGANTLR